MRTSSWPEADGGQWEYIPRSRLDTTLASGHTFEGYVRFPAPHGKAALPEAALTTFWHGDYLFEQPVMLGEWR